MDTVHGVMMRMTSAGRSLLADDRLGAERVLTSEGEMVSSETDTSVSPSWDKLLRLVADTSRFRIYEGDSM